MPEGIQINGKVLVELRKLRRMGQDDLSNACGSEGWPVPRALISDYERGKKSPTPQNLDAMCRGLALTRSEVRALVHTPTLDAATSNGTTDEGDDAQRRTATKILGLGAVSAALSRLKGLIRLIESEDRPVDSAVIADHEGVSAILANAYCTTRPDGLAPSVFAHAASVGTLLEHPVQAADLRRLERMAVGVFAEAGMLAFFVGDVSTARHYFADALLVAEEADDDTLRARALGVTSILHSPVPRGGVGGDAERSIRLLTQAVSYGQHADPHTQAWIHRWLALELAVTKDERGFWTHMALADALPCEGDEKGFFSASSMFNATTPEMITANLGSGLVALGRVDEAFHVLGGPCAPNAKWQSIVAVNTAVAYVLIDEPEQACSELLTASAYGMDRQRIRGVRARFPEIWTPLVCVQDVDEQLFNR